jgi:hypothetical protein
VFLVCAQSFICLGIFLCTHVCMWHAPIRSWATNQLQPSLWSWGCAASARPRIKMGHASAGNMRMSVKKDILLRASTRNASKSPDKDLVEGEHPRPAGLWLWTRRTTWRAWTCVKLQSLCARFRVLDVSTHSGVNSWPFRYGACEQPLLAWRRVHFRKVWMTWNKKTVSITEIREIGEMIGMGLGLGKPKQVFVFGSVWAVTEYSVRKPRRRPSFCGVSRKFFFSKTHHTVVNDT